MASLVLNGASGEQGTGDLFADEGVDGAIAVEALDDVVPVTPGFVKDESAKRDGIGVPDDIQPVACPAFAERGRAQQAVHAGFVRRGRIILEEGAEFVGCGRKAGQDDVEPATQRGAVRRTGEAEVVARGGLSEMTVDAGTQVSGGRPMFGGRSQGCVRPMGIRTRWTRCETEPGDEAQDGCPQASRGPMSRSKGHLLVFRDRSPSGKCPILGGPRPGAS